MTDATVFLLGKLIVGAQLVVPVALGLPALRSMSAVREHRRRGTPRAGQAADATSGTSALAPLTCPACHAPVPLLAAEFACPYCAARVAPPDDYVRTLAGRAQAQRELARAERRWRWSRWSSARVTTVTLRVLLIAWSLLVLAACAVMSDSWPGLVLLLAVILMIVLGLVGMALISVLAAARRELPPLPARDFAHCPAEDAACHGCAAPVRFAEDAWSVLCGYCGSDEYRAGAVAAARADAGAHLSAARSSLLEAVRALDMRRSEVLAVLSLMVIAEAFFIAVFLLFALADAAGC